MTDEARAALGIERLPTSLAAALDRFEASEMLAVAMGGPFHAAYLVLKRAEVRFAEALDEAALVRRYVEAY